MCLGVERYNAKSKKFLHFPKTKKYSFPDVSSLASSVNAVALQNSFGTLLVYQFLLNCTGHCVVRILF